jgi:hypothetical protein
MKKFGFALVALALGVSSITAAFAEDPWVKKAYVATWESKTPQGNSTSKVYNDGKGHGRMEIDQSGRKTITLIDWPGKKVTILIEQGKMAMQMPLKEGDYSQAANSSKKNKVKDLGTKMIDGRLVRGALYNFDGTMSEQWVSDDLKVDVDSTTTTPKFGKSTRHLTSYQAVTPSADLFKVPAGYKMMPQQ